MVREFYDLSAVTLDLAPVTRGSIAEKWMTFFESFDQVGLRAIVNKGLRASASSAYYRHQAQLGGKKFKFGISGGVFTIQRIK